MRHAATLAPLGLAAALALTACGAGSGSAEPGSDDGVQTAVQINSAEDLSDLITDAGFHCSYEFSEEIDKETDLCSIDGSVGGGALVNYYTNSHYAAEGMTEYAGQFSEADQNYYAVSGAMWIVWSDGKDREIIQAVANATGEKMVVHKRG